MKKEYRTRILDALFAVIGVIGTIIILYGQHIELPQLAYISGSVLMFLTAIHFKIIYFMAMELIQIAGHGANFLKIGPYLQFAIPFLLSLQLLIYYCMTGPFNFFLLFAVIANCVLSLAFTYDNQWIYLFGGTGIASYAYYCVFKQGQKACYIWAILNTIFSLTAAYLILEQYIYG